MEAKLSGINKKEVLGYLGCGAAAELDGEIAAAWEQLRCVAAPRLTYRLFERDDAMLPESITASRDIQQLLRESHHVVLFAATLGVGVDVFFKKLQLTDMAAALVFDTCANSAIENVCDNFCADIEKEFGFTTERFSPGYGDLPLDSQRSFDAVLDLQRSVGITLTDGGFMLPQKSVTAILGIADIPQPRRDGRCEDCARYEICTLRKEGKRCGL